MSPKRIKMTKLGLKMAQLPILTHLRTENSIFEKSKNGHFSFGGAYCSSY